ncbi:MAG TPA: 4-hydroxy-3-methylbut-2-en-1-yl diphosphate synthase [Lachnospiraceae bacterium]|nr:4-hydroxy-3-methylbut-2-en-1-yl diphosphate synthase [Lachnospiraceae bacterium]
MGFINRKKTKVVDIGGVKIGGDNPVAIQSMCNTKTADVAATVNQIKALESVGCEIVRVAVPDMEAAEAIKEIKKQINIPLVADIHFDYRLALKAAECGIDKLRINPGNIGSLERIKAVVDVAKKDNIPIRIGVNSGSLEKDLLQKYGEVTPDALIESALRHVAILEKFDFENIVISIKASNVPFTMQTYSKLSDSVDYPLHLGITEAGTQYSGTIKSSVGIGAILAMGIGDTVRVSLTGDPVEEVRVAKQILKSLEMRKFGVSFVSCPTCGRTNIDLISLANAVEKRLEGINKDIKVAVMGCAVNGPGEAREADIGIAGGNNYGLIFKKGEILKKVPESELLNALMEEIEKL